MDKKALSVVIMTVRLIAVDGEHRAEADELQTLTQNVGKRYIVGSVIIGIERQDASCQCIHHILAGGFHDNVSNEAGGKTTVKDEQLFEFREFFSGGKLVEQKQICNFFIAEPVIPAETGYQVIHFISAVKESAVAGNRFSIHHFCGAYIRDVG